MRTVREWIEFLGNDENAVFALQKKDGASARLYFPKDTMLDWLNNTDWLDSPVVEARYHNSPNHHLLIIE